MYQVFVKRLPYYSIGADLGSYVEPGLETSENPFGLHDTFERSFYHPVESSYRKQDECCWGCLDADFTVPIFIPLRENTALKQTTTTTTAENKTCAYWDGMGCFCSVKCARGMMDRNPHFLRIHPDELTRLAVQLGIFTDYLPMVHSAPPPHGLLNEFGGPFNREQFRRLFCCDDHDRHFSQSSSSTSVTLLPPEPPSVRHLEEIHITCSSPGMKITTTNVEKWKAFFDNDNNNTGAQVFRFLTDRDNSNNKSVDPRKGSCGHGSLEEDKVELVFARTPQAYKTLSKHIRADFRCWQCRRYRTDKPIYHTPLDAGRDNTYRVIGEFCSPECMIGFMLNNGGGGVCPIDGYDTQLSCEYSFLCGIADGSPIPAAPLPFDQTIEFGGRLTCEEYERLYCNLQQETNEFVEKLQICNLGMAYIVVNPKDSRRLFQELLLEARA